GGCCLLVSVSVKEGITPTSPRLTRGEYNKQWAQNNPTGWPSLGNFLKQLSRVFRIQRNFQSPRATFPVTARQTLHRGSEASSSGVHKGAATPRQSRQSLPTPPQC